jgi:transposase
MKEKLVRRQYTKEFKEEAISLINDKDYTVPEAAKALGIKPRLLYDWKSAADKQNEGNCLSDDEHKELVALRKENKMLRMEKEILKKASAFFAKEMK